MMVLSWSSRGVLLFLSLYYFSIAADGKKKAAITQYSDSQFGHIFVVGRRVGTTSEYSRVVCRLGPS